MLFHLFLLGEHYWPVKSVPVIYSVLVFFQVFGTKTHFWNCPYSIKRHLMCSRQKRLIQYLLGNLRLSCARLCPQSNVPSSVFPWMSGASSLALSPSSGLFFTFLFLDANTSPSTYPCQSVIDSFRLEIIDSHCISVSWALWACLRSGVKGWAMLIFVQ